MQEIKAHLIKYQERIRRSFSHPDSRAALATLIRCFDHQAFFARSLGDDAEQEQSTDVTQLNCWGLDEALRLFWTGGVLAEGIPMFRMRSEQREWGESVLQACGRIRLLEHFLELRRLGLVSITATSATVFECRYTCPNVGAESAEREDFYFLSDHYARRVQQRASLGPDLTAKRRQVLELMSDLVRPWQDNYIQYGAHPEVDSYYNELAGDIAPTRLGWDAFPLNTRFAGIPFSHYLECVRVVLGFALKHQDFCGLLCSDHPHIQPIDVLTIPSEWEKNVSYIAEGVGCTGTEAHELLLATTITPDNAQYHFTAPAGPQALHYAIGKGSVLRLMAGCILNPFLFLLRELQRKHRADWDGAVENREHIFRNDLIDQFARFERIVFFTDTVPVDSDAGITDVDAVAIDPATGTVGLFQLKWQDPFGSSMRERESKKSNFLKTSNAWIKKVHRWVEQGKLPAALVSVGVPATVANSLKRVLLFVVGRNFSHFSGEGEQDARASWGNWGQIVRLIETKDLARSPLERIFEELKEDAPSRRIRVDSAPQEIAIPGLRVVIHSPVHQAMS